MICHREAEMKLGDKEFLTFDIAGADGTVPITGTWGLFRNATLLKSGVCDIDLAKGELKVLLEPDQRGRHYVNVTIVVGTERKTETAYVNVV